MDAQQHQQVQSLASLLTTPDRGSVLQAIEIAKALDDPLIFGALLDGVSQAQSANLSTSKAPATTPSKTRAKGKPRPRAKWRRFFSIDHGSLFGEISGQDAWLTVAIAHLIAASEHPLRTSLTSLALGEPKRRTSGPIPQLWLDGLERLTSLTHLDLFLSQVDAKLDWSPLVAMSNLTHLRIRGAVQPPPLPSLPTLRDLDCMHVQLDSMTAFPELRWLSGRIILKGPLTPEIAPKLSNLKARSAIEVDGFESLDGLWCNGGQIAITGCERIGNLGLTGPSFDAPSLRHIDNIERLGTLFDVSQLDTLGKIRLNQIAKVSNATFPKGTTLAHPDVRLWGPGLEDLGNVGELEGMEVLSIVRARNPLSLETLRHASRLRVLDIRTSTGITDLTPLLDLPNLEVIVLVGSGVEHIPRKLVPLVRAEWRKGRRLAPEGPNPIRE